MTTLTSPAALPPIVTNPVAVAAEGTPLVLNILAARAEGELNSPLVQTLQDAAGPGNVITGTVAESAADGNVTVTTQNGSSVSFHHPPEIPLDLGSSVVLRLLPTTTTPQAVLLAVNGRPITVRGPAGNQTTPSNPTTAAAAARPATAAPITASVAASFIATISLEDEAAIESALDDSGLTLDATTGRTSSDPVGPTVIATLIRPAPAKLGQAPVPSGTRYLVTLREIGNADAAAPVAARPTSAAAPVSPVRSGNTPTPASPIVANLPEPPVSAAATVLLALQQAIEPAEEPTPTALPPDASADAAPPPTDQPPAAAPDTADPTAAPIASFDPAATAAADPTPPAPTPSPPDSPAPSSSASATPAATDPTMPSPAQAPAAPPPEALVAFRPQITTLAGRVIAPQTPDETLVETPIGTLALPLPAPLPLGVSVQLRVTAIAPPQTAEPHAAGHAASATSHPELAEAGFDTMTPTLVEELARVLAPSAPAAIGEIHAALALDPGDGLAAAIMTFLTGMQRRPAARGADSPARRALIESGRKDLAERLDRASRDIGTTRLPHGPDGWNVTVLPFLGPASVRPMRLYRKRHDDKDADGKSRNRPSDRFMLEVELKRIGPLQFDGLVRERRFDLVVRSREPFMPPLQRQIEQAFQDGLLISGWSGEIGFGRVGTFPMMADPESSAHLDLGA